MANEGSPLSVVELPSQAPIEFGFGGFAKRPEYEKVNDDFVDRTLLVRPGVRIVDVACGTGLITGRIRYRFCSFGSIPAEIIGVDPYEPSLDMARRSFSSLGQTMVRFEHAPGANLLTIVEPNSVDIIYFCNAIHEIKTAEEKVAVLHAISQALKPGGILLVNSAFTTKMFPSRLSQLEYGRLRERAIEILGSNKRKGADVPVFKVYSPEDYCKLMESVGLQIDRQKGIREVEVGLTSDSLRWISRYRTYIEGQLMDMAGVENFPMARKSEALVQAIDEREERLRKETSDYRAILVLPRIWVEFEAQKPMAA